MTHEDQVLFSQISPETLGKGLTNLYLVCPPVLETIFNLSPRVGIVFVFYTEVFSPLIPGHSTSWLTFHLTDSVSTLTS